MNPWYHPPANRDRRHPQDRRHANITQYMRTYERTGEWDSNIIFDAAVLGRDDIIRFALDNGCPPDQEELSLPYAALYGNLNCVQLLHSRGYRIVQMATEFAAKCQSLECLKYIVDRGGQLTSEVFQYALTNHSLNDELIQYLISKRCPLTQAPLSYAISYKHFDTIELLIKNQYQISIESELLVLNSHAADIPFENEFWRDLLFKHELTPFPKLQAKKLEYEEKKKVAKFYTEAYYVISKLILEEHMSNDILTYILSRYI